MNTIQRVPSLYEYLAEFPEEVDRRILLKAYAMDLEVERQDLAAQQGVSVEELHAGGSRRILAEIAIERAQVPGR